MLKQSARLLNRARDASILPAAARSYHEAVVDHYNRPRNVGSFDKNDPKVGTGLVGAPACGDVMKLQIRFDSEDRIVDSCFKTFGCGSAIASSSVATEWVKGKKADEVLSITNSDIAKHLSLPPVKLHCSMLAEDAIKAAVKDYKVKKMSGAQKPEQQPPSKQQDQQQQQQQQQKSKDQKAEEQRQESLQHPGSSVAGPDPADVAGG